MTHHLTQIRQLLSDIDKLFDGHEVSEASANEFGQRMAALMVSRLAEYGKQRKRTLRMSSIGRKDRILWYSMNSKAEPKAPTAQMKRNFLFGDIVEEFVLFLTKEAGHSVTDEQREVVVEGIKGHMDCVIDGTTVDVKSASPFGFKKFVEGIKEDTDVFGYRHQLSGYNYALGSKEDAYYLVMNKANGQLILSPLKYSEQPDIVDRIKKVKVMIAEPEPPERCYLPVPDGQAGNIALDRQCSWCDYKKECWPNVRTFQYSYGTKDLIHVAKLPRVEEIV